MKRLIVLALFLAGCHSSVSPPPPPAMGTASISWSEQNVGSPVCPQGQPTGCLNGYSVLDLTSGLSFTVGPGITTWSWQTTVGAHTVEVYDNYLAPTGAMPRVLILTETVTVQ
jgi:hypothetical protein